MSKDKKEKTSASQLKKENQDFPNLPLSGKAAPKPTKKQITKSSEINDSGKTDNTEDHQ